MISVFRPYSAAQLKQGEPILIKFDNYWHIFPLARCDCSSFYFYNNSTFGRSCHKTKNQHYAFVQLPLNDFDLIWLKRRQ